VFILKFLKIVKDLIPTTLQDVFSNRSTERKRAGKKKLSFMRKINNEKRDSEQLYFLCTI